MKNLKVKDSKPKNNEFKSSNNRIIQMKNQVKQVQAATDFKSYNPNPNCVNVVLPD